MLGIPPESIASSTSTSVSVGVVNTPARAGGAHAKQRVTGPSRSILLRPISCRHVVRVAFPVDNAPGRFVMPPDSRDSLMVRSTALDAVRRGAHEAEAGSLAYTDLRGVTPGECSEDNDHHTSPPRRWEQMGAHFLRAATPRCHSIALSSGHLHAVIRLAVSLCGVKTNLKSNTMP